jgi:hypothetical protein
LILASKPVESPQSVSGDWLLTCEIARNRAIFCRFVREVREGKKPAFSEDFRMAGAPGFEPGNGGIKPAVPHKHWNNAVQWINLSPRSVGHHRDRLVSPEPELAPARHRGVGFAVSECMRRPVKQFELSR